MGQLFRMRAPNGQEKDIPQEQVDFFRKQGAVLLGPAEEPEGYERPRPPAPSPIYDALTAQNVTGTGAEGMVRAATGRFGDFNADFGRGLGSSVANMALSADNGIRYMTGMGPRDPNSLVGRVAEAPNSWGGTLGRLGGDVATYAAGEGALKALPALAKYGRAGQLGAEMAAGAGITGLQTGGDPYAMAAGAAFPVIGAARSAMAPNAVGRGGKLLADAALGYGAGYTLSGGDTDTAMLGALGVPALTGGYAGSKALARGAGRLAAGAQEGGVGGALASVVRKVTPQDPWRMIVQAVKPRNSQVNFEKNLPNVIPVIKHVAETAGMPLTTADEVLAATKLAKQTVRSQFDDVMGNRAREVDLTPLANLQRVAIPSILETENPQAYARALRRADVYRGLKVPLEKAEDFLQQTNAALEAYYTKRPGAKRKALQSKPKVAMLEAKAKALRNVLYGDNPRLPQPARLLNQRYGQLFEFEDTLLSRRNVADRQQPESLSQQIGKVAAVGKGITGAYQLLHGDPSGLAHLAGAKAMNEAATFLKEQQTTNALLRRAFEMVPGPGPRRPVAGMIGTGARRMPPAPDTSGPIPGNGPGQYAQPEMRPGQRQLPAGPEPVPPRPVTQMGPAPDTSYARGVPAELGEAVSRPGQPQLPGRGDITREQIPLPGRDPSEVVSVPATYGEPMDPSRTPWKGGSTAFGFVGPAAAQMIPNDPESQWDDYAKLALNVGGVAALGAAGAKAIKGKKPPAFEYLPSDTPAVQGRMQMFKDGKMSFARLPQASKPRSIHSTILANGGISVQPVTGQMIVPKKPGPAMVGLYPNAGPKGNAEIPLADFKPRHVEKFLLDNRATFAKDPEAFVGGWVDDGVVYLDISRGHLTKQGQPNLRAATKMGEVQMHPEAVRNEKGELMPRGQKAVYMPESDTFPQVGNLYEFLQSPQFRNRMTAMAKIGREAMGGDNPEWWNIVNGPMAEAYGRENVEALAGYIASTSPQNGPVANLKMASELMRRHLKDIPVRDEAWRAPATAMGKVDAEGNRVFLKKDDPKSGKKAGDAVSEGFAPSYSETLGGQKFPNLTTYAKNAEKVQAGQASTVTEDKVNDMFHALMGKLVGVFDRHWAKIAENPAKGIYADTVSNRLAGSMTSGNIEAYPVVENAVRDAAKAAGVDVSKYSAWVWEGIRSTIRKHGKLFGQVHDASAIPETTTGFNEIFLHLADAKAKHLGITRQELYQRLRSGDAELLAALLSTPIGAAAYQRWRDSEPASPDSGGPS